MQTAMQKLFLLDPDIHFLNHGSFGACPRLVFEAYQALQREIEHQPINLLDREIRQRMQASRQALADYVGCGRDDLVYFPNPTTAINMVARNLEVSPGDEILSTDHEYGAMDRTWRYFAKKSGAKYINYPIPLPVKSHQEFIEKFWGGVTPHTKIIFISHITSPTALTFPVKEICQRARKAGIMSIVDGAHAPGQIPVDLKDMQPDIYVGACHKWLCAPKGSAFLFVRKAYQGLLDPLVISWGYDPANPSETQFIDYHEWQGTRDMSPFLALPEAITFLSDNNWPAVQADCRRMLSQARADINQALGQEPVCLDDGDWFQQMAAIQLPEVDPDKLKTALYDDFQVEIPVYRWNGKPILRISIQAYNTHRDIDALLDGLKVIIPKLTRD